MRCTEKFQLQCPIYRSCKARRQLTASAFRAAAVARCVDRPVLITGLSRAGLLARLLLAGVLLGCSLRRFPFLAVLPASPGRVVRVRVRIVWSAFKITLVGYRDLASWLDGLTGEDDQQGLVRIDVIAEDRANDRVRVTGLRHDVVSRGAQTSA